MSKIVLNQCYCDMFDISEEAKEFLRNKYGVIFDPNLTPRNDPALIQTIEILGDAASIFYTDDKGVVVYLSKPVVYLLPSTRSYLIQSNCGYETIELLNIGLKRKKSEQEIEPLSKKLR